MSEERPSLEQLYEKAKAALAGKDYERAVRLLREIVLQDAEYQDASQLLAQAIAWQRRKWWQEPRLLVIPVAFLFLAVLFWALQPASPLRVALALPTPTATVTPTSTSTPWPTSTPRPTTTPTPAPTAIPLAWHRLYGGHIFPRDTITAIVVDPEDPKVFYVGTSNAGIYKSIDGGLSWQPMHNGLGRAWIHTLVIDPRDPRTLYAAVSLGGVYKTTDGGETWQAVNEGIDVGTWEAVSVVALDPQDSQHLYYTPSFVIYESLDGGKSWTNVRTSACPNQIVDLVVHPVDGKTLFAGTWPRNECEGGVYKSEDAGRTWTLTGLEVEGEWMQLGGVLEIDSQKGDYLYAVGRDGGLYASSNGGNNWSRLPQACWQAPAIDPDDGAVAYCGIGNSIMKTADGGQTWEYIWRDLARASSIAVSPHSPETVLVGGNTIYMSTDGGVSWVERSSGLGGTRLDLMLDPSDSSTLYANSGALFRSSTSGRTWEFFSPGHDLAFDADGTTLYRLADDSIFRSRDQGQTWEKLVMPVERQISDVATHPRKPGALYAFYGSDGQIGLYLSSDSGLTWQAASGLGVIHDPILYFDHDQGQVMYAIGHWSAYHSNDAGNTWEACADPGGWLAYSSQSGLAISPRDSNWLILATQGRGVLVSRDGCQSWEPSNNGLGNLFVNTVAIDPQNPDTIYAGTDGGAYVSFDSGEHWGVVNEGLLGATVVYSIVVDPQDPDNVYSATPYGIFKLERR